MRTGWNQVARDVLLDRRSRERGIIDPPAVEQLLRSHAAGSADDGDRIWSLLNLELWHRTFIDNEGVQTLPERHRSAAVPHTEIRHAESSVPQDSPSSSQTAGAGR
jgi:hypothetical protein